METALNLINLTTDASIGDLVTPGYIYHISHLINF